MLTDPIPEFDSGKKLLLEALKKCRSELISVQDGSTGGVPNAICALIPEAIEAANAAIASVSA